MEDMTKTTETVVKIIEPVNVRKPRKARVQKVEEVEDEVEVVEAKPKPKSKPKPRPNMGWTQEQYDYDHEDVRGQFMYHESPGGTLKFFYGKYDYVKTWELKDGEIVTLPRYVAEHLQNDIKYRMHTYLQDSTGKRSTKAGRLVARCSFNPLDFAAVDKSREQPLVKRLSV